MKSQSSQSTALWGEDWKIKTVKTEAFSIDCVMLQEASPFIPPLFVVDETSNGPPNFVRPGVGGSIDWMLEWLVGLSQLAGVVQLMCPCPLERRREAHPYQRDSKGDLGLDITLQETER